MCSLHLQFWPASGRSGSTSSAGRRRTRWRRCTPVARTARGASRSLTPRTSLRVRSVQRARRTAVPGATLVGVGVGTRTPLARRRTPSAGLAATSSHPDRTITGVRHGDTRGTAGSICRIILTPRKTWPGGRSSGLAAGSPRSKRTGRRTSHGCTARRTQH